jgi:hypothetical protein
MRWIFGEDLDHRSVNVFIVSGGIEAPDVFGLLKRLIQAIGIGITMEE